MSRVIPPGYVLGTDGKVYPDRPLSHDQRAAIVGRVHYLSHDEHLSVRQIITRLGEEGFYASVGTVHAWLRWRCDGCVQVGGNVTPEQSGGGRR